MTTDIQTSSISVSYNDIIIDDREQAVAYVWLDLVMKLWIDADAAYIVEHFAAGDVAVTADIQTPRSWFRKD